MATPYSKIREKFLEKPSSYDLLKFTDSDRNSIIDGYMISACANFYTCKKNLSERDELSEQFNGDLTDKEIEIIVAGMLVEHLKPKVYHSDIMANFLNAKDLSIAASPANMLKELRITLNECRAEFKHLMIEYTYIQSNASELTL